MLAHVHAGRMRLQQFAERGSSSASVRSLMLIRNTRVDEAGSNTSPSCALESSNCIASRTRPTMFSASGVGIIPAGVLTNSGSFRVLRSAPRLTAGCVMFSTSAARVRLRLV